MQVQLNTSRDFQPAQTVNNHQEIHISDHKSVQWDILCQRQAQTKATVKSVAERIRGNPLRKQDILTREMKIPPRTISRIIKEDLRLANYHRGTGQRLTAALRNIRAKLTKKLLQRHAYGGHKHILFTDEKIFTVEEKFNRQNDKVYAPQLSGSRWENCKDGKRSSHSFSDGLVGSVVNLPVFGVWR